MLRNTIARLQFWWATKTLVEGKDYTLEIVEDSGVLVTFIRGKYNGIVITFVNIHINEGGVLEFQTVVMYNPYNESMIYSRKFNRVTANIMRMLLHGAVRGKTKVNSNEDREIDTSQSDEERDFHEESSSVLEKRVSKRKPRKKAPPRDS